jgi:hypothetical protein
MGAHAAAFVETVQRELKLALNPSQRFRVLRNVAMTVVVNGVELCQEVPLTIPEAVLVFEPDEGPAEDEMVEPGPSGDRRPSHPLYTMW